MINVQLKQSKICINITELNTNQTNKHNTEIKPLSNIMPIMEMYNKRYRTRL